MYDDASYCFDFKFTLLVLHVLNSEFTKDVFVFMLISSSTQ